MGEFQVAGLCDQELIDTAIDTALASALVAYGGDVLILLPALRPDVRAMWGHPEFVVKVHEYVSARSHDPKYRRAFASYTPLRELLARPATTSAVPHQVQSLRVRWAVVSATVAR